MFEHVFFFANAASDKRPWWTFPAAAAVHGLVLAVAFAASLAAVSVVEDPEILIPIFMTVTPPPPPPAAKARNAKQVEPAPATRTDQLSQPETVEPLTKQDFEAQSSIGDDAVAAGADNGVEGGVDEGVDGGVEGSFGTTVSGGWNSILGDALAPEHQGPIDVTGDVVPPRIIHRVQPEYPDVARRARVAGVVELRAVISENGDVEELTIVRGHPALVEAALGAVQQWRYSPARLDGRPVRVFFKVLVTFQLV